jgi:hypothetical protein
VSHLVRFFLVFAVLGSFVAAGLLALYTQTPTHAVGALLLGGGLTAVAFARTLGRRREGSGDQTSPFRYWLGARPLTFVLWGSGVALLGVLQLTVF